MAPLRRGGGASDFLPIPRRRKDTEELAFDLKRNAFEVRRAVDALLREGSIVKFDTDREGGPFYTPVGYVEASDRLDNSDLVLSKDYSGQYEARIWRDDA